MAADAGGRQQIQLPEDTARASVADRPRGHAAPVPELEARLYQPEVDALRVALERVPRWRRSMRPFLDDVAERTGILGPHDGPEADWRFWHRTFREALTAEALEEQWREVGEAAVLEHARAIAGDESRWAEPYALLAGRVEDPDALVRSLVEVNRALGLRAVATAQGLRDSTLAEILELTAEWKDRAEVYERIPELVDEPLRTMALLDRLRRRTRDGNDLFFLEQAVAAVGQKWPDAERSAAQLRARFYDHIPLPPENLFRWIETRDGRVALWREIPAGRFQMGSPEGEDGDREHPRHSVSVMAPFQMATVPVTNVQYAAFDPAHRPHPWKDVPAEELPRHPVVGITWFEAAAFCRWLSNVFSGVRLPGEEEWEWACRAGTQTRFWNGNRERDLARVAWFGEPLEDGTTHRVGEKPANAWGLYDVHGNVWEWTSSPWSDDYSGREAGVEIDPAAVEPPGAEVATDERRVSRGGCCWDEATWARSASRLRASPGLGLRDQGFRVLRPSAEADPESGPEFFAKRVE